ncbi:ATP-dependent helicase HrpB [Actinokineospora bangkokensis]|uniref:ATP-dependent helicase HrpB n=1 Tax=Actinokineospora bangkokensis TaxID=1193682 RepID=A0A1Q9LCC3_9PSEU|nr:ATP-dependent helicase HrpB [Actinokineospora bangkokensis]OLR89656.1 ATP-dependent helicase HrpB [Actinokineospora bangkokensis]
MDPVLPVHAALDDIAAALADRGAAVLVAPPGTGKTTVVPLALPGRVVVAEPRRLAARAAATRMAASLGEAVGGQVGYSVRGDRRVSAATRVEFVTSGLLVRRLQHDPELAGVDVVVLDEVHERHLDADLLLALLLDARDGLRPDLRLLATSATVAATTLADLLDAPVITVDAVAHPVAETYVPPQRGERVESTVARAVRTALSAVDGDVLAFLPGVGEIRRVAGMLSDLDVVELHGRLPLDRQSAALRPGEGRRVVLATSVAESSLTVPGVRAVVDSGLSRVPRVDHRRGMSGLATVRVSAAVATQRAGRAGREAPGRVFRCWPEHEQSTLPRYPEPEVRTADLTRLALELAVWGTPDGSGLRWWDAPPPGPLAAGREVLTALGALDPGGVTARGREMARLGLHPRLARALLDAAPEVGSRAAAEVVAVLDDDGLVDGVDLEAGLRRLRAGSPSTARWRREVDRLLRDVPAARGSGPAAALVTALAHPERVGRRRPGADPVYLLANGTAVTAPGLGDPEWIAVAVADRPPGAAEGRARLAVAASQDLAVRVGDVAEADEVAWSGGDVVARHVRRVGAIVLSSRPLATPPADAVRAAVLDGLRRDFGVLRFSPAATALRNRLRLLHAELGPPWPAVSDADLLAAADRWLGSPRSRADLEKLDLLAALRTLLPWPEAAHLDDLAPERLPVPSGSAVRVDYTADRPTLPVKVQEVFGWTDTPTIVDGRVPVVLHLLSPAGRPVAVTADLRSFWAQGYPQVRSELRGRYPKHRWPEDPLTAEPTRHTTQRRKP